jgi:hypothetical protein
LDGVFTVDADSNTTTNATGRCECDAEGAFSVLGSATLNLNSWEYHATGTNDSIWGVPSISNLDAACDGGDVEITWDTDYRSTSKVNWGYSAGSLTNTDTGADGTSHLVIITPTVGSTVYYQAVSHVPGCPADSDTSPVESIVRAVTIGDIDAVFDPIACTVTIDWDTNIPATTKVLYGGRCTGLTYNETVPGYRTSHEVVIDVGSGFRYNTMKYKVQSSNCGDTETSSCGSVMSGPCQGQ